LARPVELLEPLAVFFKERLGSPVDGEFPAEAQRGIVASGRAVLVELAA
jgi:hypothetical protein